MLQNLLLTNLFLVANAFITLAFFLYAWIYLDLFIQRKKYYALSIGVGGILLGTSFISLIVFEVFGGSALRDYMFLFLQFLGLFCVAYGYGQEIIPGEPKKRRRGTKLKSLFLPFFVILSAFGNFFLSAFITAKTLHKVGYGHSKEFRPLIFFWIIISLVLLVNIVAILSQGRFPLLEISLMRYSFAWAFIQVLLLVAFVLMYQWIRLFLTFRNFTKILFDIWSFSILLCVLITSVFISLHISNYESEVGKVLQSNGRMVSLNISQVRDANLDVLNFLSADPSFLGAVVDRDFNSLDEQLRLLTVNNINLDRVLVIDTASRVMYDSERYSLIGELISGNIHVRESLNTSEEYTGYWIKDDGTLSETLTYQVLVPLFTQDGTLMAVLSGIKYIDGDFLYYLHQYTGQEFVMIDRDFNVISKAFNEDFLHYDILKINRFRYLDDYGSVFVDINGNVYLGSAIDIYENKTLVSLSSYDMVVSATQGTLYMISFYAILVSVLAFIPSYYIARKIEKDAA